MIIIFILRLTCVQTLACKHIPVIPYHRFSLNNISGTETSKCMFFCKICLVAWAVEILFYISDRHSLLYINAHFIYFCILCSLYQDLNINLLRDKSLASWIFTTVINHPLIYAPLFLIRSHRGTKAWWEIHGNTANRSLIHCRTNTHRQTHSCLDLCAI